jgi:hypothetical protein
MPDKEIEVLCTSCHERVRPVVAIDIDGTLCQYHVPFGRFALQYHNKVVSSFEPLESIYFGGGNFEDALQITQEQYRAAKLAYRLGGHKRWAPAYGDALGVPRRVRELGAELWLCSTRPWQAVQSIDADTQEWLRRNDLLSYVNGLLYGDDKYVQLKEAVGQDRVVAVVDDLREQCEYAADLGLPAVQIMRQHNSQDRWDDRWSWDVIMAWLERNIREWEEKIGAKA